MHALILMSPSGTTPPDAESGMEHERFIDGLDDANKIVLGGGWKPAAGGFEAAYLVNCDSLDEAARLRCPIPWSKPTQSVATWWSGSSSD